MTRREAVGSHSPLSVELTLTEAPVSFPTLSTLSLYSRSRLPCSSPGLLWFPLVLTHWLQRPQLYFCFIVISEWLSYANNWEFPSLKLPMGPPCLQKKIKAPSVIRPQILHAVSFQLLPETQLPHYMLFSKLTTHLQGLIPLCFL